MNFGLDFGALGVNLSHHVGFGGILSEFWGHFGLNFGAHWVNFGAL